MSTRIRASNQEKISPRQDLVLYQRQRDRVRGKSFGGVSACRCSLYGLYPGRIKFFLSLLLRFLGSSTFNSSKHLAHIILQFCDSFLSTLILVAHGLKQYSQCKHGAQTQLLMDVAYFLDQWQLTRVTLIASLNPLQSTSRQQAQQDFVTIGNILYLFFSSNIPRTKQQMTKLTKVRTGRPQQSPLYSYYLALIMKLG